MKWRCYEMAEVFTPSKYKTLNSEINSYLRKKNGFLLKSHNSTSIFSSILVDYHIMRLPLNIKLFMQFVNDDCFGSYFPDIADSILPSLYYLYYHIGNEADKNIIYKSIIHLNEEMHKLSNLHIGGITFSSDDELQKDLKDDNKYIFNNYMEGFKKDEELVNEYILDKDKEGVVIYSGGLVKNLHKCKFFIEYYSCESNIDIDGKIEKYANILRDYMY